MCCEKGVFEITHFYFLRKYKSSSNLISANDQEVCNSFQMIIRMLYNISEVLCLYRESEFDKFWKFKCPKIYSPFN